MIRKNINSIIFFSIGMFFIIYSIVTNNYSYIGLGICFMVLTINYYNDNKEIKKDKNKKNRLIIILIIILLVIGTLFNNYQVINKEYLITDTDYLYDVAIDYIKNEKLNTGHDRDKNNYQVFIDYKGFGITEDKYYKYAYMWILIESFYTEDGLVISSEGSSMPYKFIFKNNRIIKYEIPKDGTEYISSVRKLFPYNIDNKVLKFEMNNKNILKAKEKYYSSLIY